MSSVAAELLSLPSQQVDALACPHVPWGAWYGPIESCFVVRASKAYRLECSANDHTTYNAIRLLSGRYFKFDEGLYIQEKMGDDRAQLEMCKNSDTYGGYWISDVSQHPNTIVGWVAGESHTGPIGAVIPQLPNCTVVDDETKFGVLSGIAFYEETLVDMMNNPNEPPEDDHEQDPSAGVADPDAALEPHSPDDAPDWNPATMDDRPKRGGWLERCACLVYAANNEDWTTMLDLIEEWRHNVNIQKAVKRKEREAYAPYDPYMYAPYVVPGRYAGTSSGSQHHPIGQKRRRV